MPRVARTLSVGPWQDRVLQAEEEARCRRLSVYLLANLEGRDKDVESFLERAKAEAPPLPTRPPAPAVTSALLVNYW
jgi:hypothetical protein